MEDDLSQILQKGPPTAGSLARLKPRDCLGFAYLLSAIATTSTAIILASLGSWPVWLLGQLVLALALLQWFILVHEAGHQTLFRTNALNLIFGHIAGFFAGLPYMSWKLVHYRHHKWTGWQDLDATTVALVPRKLGNTERFLINSCWRLWIPIFNVIYRYSNYWDYRRIVDYLPNRRTRRHVFWNVFCLGLLYVAAIVVVGPINLLEFSWLGLVLTLAVQENILLSQHTHIPMRLSSGVSVKPFGPIEQENYTRSLRFPRWIAQILLMNFGHHELHHMYVRIPGYHLNKIDYRTNDEVNWWEWIKESRRLSGEVFLFSSREKSGFQI